MLIDSNIIIEIGRSQVHRQECKELVEAIRFEMLEENAYITKFAVSAIEALIGESNGELVRDILLLVHQGKLKIFETKIEDDLLITSVKKDLKLDFDDALHFIAANRLGTYLVTLDKDFSHTTLETKTPKEVIEALANAA